jgi:ribonuclease P protein component
VTVTFVPVGPGPRARVAYAVGRRAGKAVKRNRLRRRLRAAVDQVRDLAPGAYLVAAGPEAAEMGFEELKEQVARAMTSASGSER